MVTLPEKERFEMPEGIIYLDGNSLGPLPKGVAARIAHVAEKEWAQDLIRGWNVDDWMGQPLSVAERIGRLVGAPEGTTVLGDTLTLKIYQALASALEMRPGRRVILSDRGNFPTALSMAEGLIRQLGQGHELRLVDHQDIAAEIGEDVAAVLLTHVDYRTGRMYDMAAVTELAHASGCVMIWDLAHSAGAVPVNLAACRPEFAAGCTYKYLNGGPGAPAFICVRPDIIEQVEPALAGWLGHAAPFAFELSYRPAPSIERFRIGTPPVLQVAALDAALDAWEGVDMAELRAASIALGDQFIREVEAKIPGLQLVSPRNGSDRGSQVSFAFEDGYAAMQALIARGVIGDFRAPNIMRFGFTPLFIGPEDVSAAVDIMANVMLARLWDDPKYKATNRVT